jgi:hypothetical protein
LDKFSCGPINFGTLSNQNSTVENNLAVKSCEQSGLLAQKFPLLWGRVAHFRQDFTTDRTDDTDFLEQKETKETKEEFFFVSFLCFC